MSKAPHTLTRTHKQLASRAPGTVVDLECTDCAGHRVAQLVYVGRNDVDLVVFPLAGDSYTENLDHELELSNDPAEALEWAQLFHTNDLADPLNARAWTTKNATVPTSSRIDTPEQLALPWPVIAEHIAAAYIARLVPELARDTAAGHHWAHDRDLMLIQILQTISDQTGHLARKRATMVAKMPDTTQSEVARALGVSRQRVHQILNES